MQFHPLAFITRLLTGTDAYQSTPSLNHMSQILNGKPEFLAPDTWDAYDIYLTTPQLYAVIQRRGYLLASGQWKHYNKLGKEIENSPYVQLLENPNPLMKGNDLIRQWNENKCIYGNNYEYVNRAFATADPSTLNNLPPAQMEMIISGKIYKQTKIDDIILGYKLRTGIDIETFETKDINHTRVVNGKNPVKGESPMIPLHMPISNIRAAYGFRNVIITKKGALGILSNNAKDSSGAIPLNETERLRLEREYQRAYGMGDTQSQVIMTNSSLNWQPMTYPTKDLMLFEEVDINFKTIIDQYGLNDNLFSKDKGATFENMAEGLRQAYQSTIIPEAEELAMNRTTLFGLEKKGEFLELDYSHIPILQQNQKEKAEILEKKANAMNILSQLGTYSAQELKDIIQL